MRHAMRINWLDRLAKGGGLVFCGKPGTGKNHLACAIANSIIENHQAKVLISTALRIARDIKNSWSRDSQISEERTIKTYTDKDLLIIVRNWCSVRLRSGKNHFI